MYRHFPTKELLFEAVVLDRMSALVDRMRSVAASEPGEAFFSALTAVVSKGMGDRDLVDALTRTAVTPGLTSANLELRTALGVLLVRGQEVGEVRGDVSIGVLMTLVRGVLLAAYSGSCEVAGALAVIGDGLRESGHR